MQVLKQKTYSVEMTEEELRLFSEFLEERKFTGETKLINKALKNLKLTEIGLKEGKAYPAVIDTARLMSPHHTRDIKRIATEIPLKRGRAVLRYGADESSHLNRRITKKGSALMRSRTGGNHMSKREIKEAWGERYYHPNREDIKQIFYDNPRQELQRLKHG